jgi:cyanophycinase
VPATGLSGTLLLIGGGLDDDNRPVFERFAALASAKGPARIVIATAASGDQGAAAQGREQALATWCPQARIDVITRETPATDAAALIDRATAMFFTGGDQKRITERYRKDGQDGDEVRAMRRLLARGGVIAGTSAGDAMMGDRMMLSGRSPAALGVAPAATADEEEPVSSRREPRLGPQVGPGMGFVPWVLTDSHFFERDRVGRLVAALEATGTRLGLGVGEDACVEIDLATGDVIGTTVAESLLVDAGAVHRDGHTRRGVRARLLAQGTRVSLIALLAKPPAPMPALPPPVQVMPIAEPGQHRQLASWRLFTRASKPDGGAWRLQLDGWSILAWPAGDGEVCFAVGPDA